MKKLILSILLLASCATPTQTREPTFAPNTLLIGDEDGGEPEVFRGIAIRLSLANRPIALTGACMSACTILLQPKFNLDICATSSATLHFHMPYYIGKESKRILLGPDRVKQSIQKWRDEWLGNFSSELNLILERATIANRIPIPSLNGDDTTTFFIAAERVVKACN